MSKVVLDVVTGVVTVEDYTAAEIAARKVMADAEAERQAALAPELAQTAADLQALKDYLAANAPTATQTVAALKALARKQAGG